MTTINLAKDTLDIRFTMTEKILGLVSDIDIPLGDVVAAVAVTDGIRAARGLRAPGLGVPGRRKLGTWRLRGERSLVAVRRGEPTLAVTLKGHHYTQVLVSTPQAGELAREITERLHPSSST